MVRKFICFLLLICLVWNAPVLAAAEKPIQLYVNNEKIIGINPILKSGVMYVPYRKFFEAMGYKTSFDPDTLQISGLINGSEIIFWAGEDVVEYDGYYYDLDESIPVINGQVYFPLRFAGQFIKCSVIFDKEKLSASMMKYGDGQETAVHDLVVKFFRSFSPKLLTYDNPKIGYNSRDYDYEANQHESEIPVREFSVNIGGIEYSSANEATLQVTYIENTQVLNRKEEYVFEIRKERGLWRISNFTLISAIMNLPKDINETAAKVIENQNKEQSEVLSDLRTYYKARNEENLDLTVQYTTPSFIEKWNNIDDSTKNSWEKLVQSGYDHDVWKYMLTEERVVFLGKSEAVVQGTREWSDILKGVTDVNEVLIFMNYANGHWNYSANDFYLDKEYKLKDSEQSN